MTAAAAAAGGLFKSPPPPHPTTDKTLGSLYDSDVIIHMDLRRMLGKAMLGSRAGVLF